MTRAAAITVTGVILAGGASRRWGGIDKALVNFNGIPLIEHVISRLRPQVNDIVISANRNGAIYRHYGYPVLPDILPGQLGPLAGIFTGISYAQQHTSHFLIVPCDVPYLPLDLSKRLLSPMHELNAQLCIPSDGEYSHWVFLLGKTQLSDDLAQYLEQGGRKVASWVKTHPYGIADFSAQKENFLNLNSPEDFAKLVNRTKK